MPRLTKKGRERERERQKADKALGGALLVDPGKNHEHKEVQWFRLLRGQNRLNQIARILVELAPQNVFNPKTIYEEQLEEESTISSAERLKEQGTSKKNQKGKVKKMSKREEIIAKNKAKLEKKAAARDQEKLKSMRNVMSTNTSGVTLKTEEGKLLLLNQVLKTSIQNEDVISTLDCLWEIEEVARALKKSHPNEVARIFSDFQVFLSKAIAQRKNIKDLIPAVLKAGQVKISPIFKPKNLVEFQLTCMSDRLPPLSSHALKGKFKLDEWQLRVLKLIDARKSVLITAPTSCGKTVLSTYVCGLEGKTTLFVVPTEPLAWQVAAMLRALKLEIALVVPTLNFVPPAFSVVVGTPHALESTLTKQIGFDFDTAVYDEVHSLNNDRNGDGAALQRIIRAMPKTCKSLALSATIGNSEALLGWWENLLGKNEVALVKHTARFINLQRHIWCHSENDVVLEHLHPCLSLSVDYLASGGFSHNDLALTPVDAFNLFKAMDYFDEGEESSEVLHSLLKKLKPRKFFDENQRITLMNAKDYEDHLKQGLVKLAMENRLLTKKILAALSLNADLKEISALQSEEDVDSYLQAHFRNRVELSSKSTSIRSLLDLLYDLRNKELVPGILFQLDSVRCQSFFDGVLRGLESDEAVKYPNYHDELVKQEEMQLKQREKMLKQFKNQAKQDDAMRDESEFNVSSIDSSAPHPDFSLSPSGKGIGATEAKDVSKVLSNDLPKSGSDEHPLVRGLRRGVGLYISGLPSSYLRVVQSLAQAGRLGVVLSDELLAYGVNMPFRSAIFFDDPGEDWLTPLVHQQMAGRAGRRGLDRQGHLVYAGFSVDRLQQLLRGELPDVVGAFPLYPSVPLQLEMNQRYESSGTKLNEDAMNRICGTPLKELLGMETKEDLKVGDGKPYFETAKEWMDVLGVLDHKESSYQDLIPELVWELRQFLPQSLALEYIIDEFVEHFKNVPVQQRDTDNKEQTEVFLVFCLIGARRKGFYFLKENGGHFTKDDFDEKLFATLDVLPHPHTKSTVFAKFSQLVMESQKRIIDAPLRYKDNVILEGEVDNLDNMAYGAFIRNQIDPSLPTPLQHDLRERLWNIGEFLRISFNILGRSKELAGVSNLVRKCFIRLRYILDETAQRNWDALTTKTVSPN